MLNLESLQHDDFDFHFHYRYDDVPNKIFCMAWVATAIVGSAVIGGAVQAYSANQAANAQQNAANQAIGLQQSIFNKTQQNLSPYINEGNTATNQLNAQLPTLTSPIQMDETALRNTPGYQFNLTQGLKATQNSAAARGLGVSGAALKGAATFATGLADSTYQNQFNNANINQTNAYNRLKGLIDTGESAAAGQGTIGANTGNNIASAYGYGGNAAAAGINGVGAGINSAIGNIGGYAAYKGLYGGGSVQNAPENWNSSLPTGSLTGL